MPEVRGLLQPFAYGRGIVQPLDVATPVAGSNASVTVDGRWSMRVLAARLLITTDANAANRLVTLDYIDARANTRLRNGAGLVLTANTTAQAYEWSSQRSNSEWAANTPVFAPLAPFFLPPGWKVQFTVTNIQATDAISGLTLWVETFGTDLQSYPVGAGFDSAER